MRKEVRERTEHLATWLLSLPEEPFWFLLGVVAALPGADALREAVAESAPVRPQELGWAELSALVDFIRVLETRGEVEEAVALLMREVGLTGPDEE